MSTNPSLDQTKAKALVDFISWAITDGQKLAANLHYVPLELFFMMPTDRSKVAIIGP